MRITIVVSRVCMRHLRIVRVERLIEVVAVMAIMMVAHIGRHIRLIVIQVNRFRLYVIRWEIAVVVRRPPYNISRTSVHIPHHRTLDEHRTYHIVRSIEPTVTHHLYIQGVRTIFGDERSHILKHRRSQTGLDEQGVIITAVGLYHAQIVNPSVTIEVEVVDHIPARIEQPFELLHATRLCKSRSDSVEIQIEREVVVVVGHRYRGHSCHFRTRSGHLRGVNRLRRSYRLNGRCYGEDTRPTTRQTQCRET